jgi:hypothetical protein
MAATPPAIDTPTGMAPANATGLVFHRGYPHSHEINNPVEYGKRPPQSYDPIEHYQWRQDRSVNHYDTGTPIVPDLPEIPPEMRGL